MKTPNQYRVRAGILASTDDAGNKGCFVIPYQSYKFTVISSDDFGWEHVSVSLQNRCPNWQEMCFIKSLFWDDEETVIQYHPPRSEYVNNHETCLHLWRPAHGKVELPPSILVGIKNHETP